MSNCVRCNKPMKQNKGTEIYYIDGAYTLSGDFEKDTIQYIVGSTCAPKFIAELNSEQRLGKNKKRMEEAVHNTIVIDSGRLDELTEIQCIDNADEVVQAVLNELWTKYDSTNKSTWPSGDAYEYVCLLKDWNNTGFKIGITAKAWQIDKWDHVVAYIEPSLLLPSNI